MKKKLWQKKPVISNAFAMQFFPVKSVYSKLSKTLIWRNFCENSEISTSCNVPAPARMIFFNKFLLKVLIFREIKLDANFTKLLIEIQIKVIKVRILANFSQFHGNFANLLSFYTQFFSLHCCLKKLSLLWWRLPKSLYKSWEHKILAFFNWEGMV